jgi:hypothetical protein
MEPNLEALAVALAKQPEKARELQVAINRAKDKAVTGSLNKAGEGIIEPHDETKASLILKEMAEEGGFKPDSECMEYKGSKQNYIFVKAQIAEKYGEEAADEYKPTVQVKPKTAWLQAGFLLKKGEEPLCHITTWRDKKAFSVALFHENQMFKA